MRRPIYLYRRDELLALPARGGWSGWTVRVRQPTFRVLLSDTLATIRVETRDDDGPWSLAEEYLAR